MSSDAGATTDEVLTIVDETLARRRYFREKQREYRHKLKADAVAIAQEVMHLESIRDRLQVVSMTSVRKASEGPLSWHAIATVFKSEAHRVLTRRQSLVTQMQQFESLKRAMRRFVVMNIPPPMSRRNAWHSVTLVADPSARNRGKEWLAQQMYHNMHEPLALLPAANHEEEFFVLELHESDNDESFTFLERFQFILPGTLASFRRHFESTMRKLLFEKPHEATVVEEVAANTRLSHTTTPDGAFLNTLQGYFVEADRFVMVMRQVENDEVHACHPLQTQWHYLSW
ncbi:hypothetical protein AaE_013364 [Aphanomyces astaci]|uniref:Uncharacterized protein n=1 Tax=Aphanomyces astaci TaxID=112090 RepID=A0A6A4ZAE1_APHAT|nr:hypothetical protein AaE_013364 [Aphanomyces astaci]